MFNELNIEAHKHSNSLELEADPNFKKRKDKLRIEKETMVALTRAWDFLDKEGLSNLSLSYLGFILDPNKNKLPLFRNSKEEIQFGPFIPPSDFYAICTAMDNLIYRLEKKDIHPIIRAIEAHIETVKIHPYIDGNGRIARLLQNYVLIKNNYPPANIDVSERSLYIKLMQGTLEDRFAKQSDIERISKKEDLLHEFIISKILHLAHKVEDYLKKHRLFELELRTPKKEIGYAVAKILRNYNAQGREGIKVNLVYSNGASILNIEGDISRDSVDRALKNYNDKIKYNVKVKDK